MGASVDVVRTWFELSSSGRIDAALELLDPAVVIHEAESLPYGGVFHGRDGFREIMDRIGGMMDFEIGSLDILDAGGVAVAKVTATFTSRSSGEAITMEVVEIYTVRDGLIVDLD